MKRLLALSLIVLLAFGVRADEWLWVGGSDGTAGLWRFRFEAPLEHVNQKKQWEHLSEDFCDKASSRTPSAKLLKLRSTVPVPNGYEVGKIAATGHWLVVEDTKNHRLLRFRIKK